MPWREVSIMSSRKEFVLLALQEGSNISELCRRFNISPKTGYKLLNRYAAEGDVGLEDRSRRPHSSPRRTSETVERTILSLRDQHPAWGARKLRAFLVREGHQGLPSPCTITAILDRHGRLTSTEGVNHTGWKRFEHPAPNDLWQMDFKGHVAMREGRCHPLTVLDDHSRYCVCLRACADEQTQTVRNRHYPKPPNQSLLSYINQQVIWPWRGFRIMSNAPTDTFRRYGLPWRMTMDNGAPWGDTLDSPYTPLTVWLLRLGIRISHSHPYHPQTQGKDERFHRTLKAELLNHALFANLEEAQREFDVWRESYNLERPHQSLDMNPPSSRYRQSPQPFLEELPPVEYAPGDIVRKVQAKGEISYLGREWRIGKAFQGRRVALRHGTEDFVMEVFFCHYPIASIDLRESQFIN